MEGIAVYTRLTATWGKSAVIRNRVREIRKSRGLTLEKLAEKTGLSVSQLSRIEKHDRGWSVTSLPKIAKALNVDIGELLDASNAWQDAKVLGDVGQTIWTRFKKYNGKSCPTVRLPAAIGEVLALTVSGPALYPRYTEGDVIAVTKKPVDPDLCIGRESLVTLDSDYVALKTVQPSGEPGRYTLISHNEPPVLSRTIACCRPVVFISRA